MLMLYPHYQVHAEKLRRELALPAFDEYMADRIDAAELDKRKAEAYAKATAEHA